MSKVQSMHTPSFEFIYIMETPSRSIYKKIITQRKDKSLE